ncbi:MAG: HEAT repeat domain-containing protein [Cyanobacteria bacterium P01_H01_bin.15]
MNFSPTSVSERLELAVWSASQQEWSVVLHYLQTLSSVQIGQLLRADREQLVDMVLMALVQGDFNQRWELTKLLPKLGGIVQTPLIQLLRDPNAETEARWFAVRILGGLPSPEVVIALTELLSTAEEELAQIAAETLAQIGPAAVDGLGALLADANIRLWVVQALRVIRTSETVPWLLPIVNDAEPQIRSLALETLGSFRDASLTPYFLQALQDSAMAPRREAVIILGRRSDLLSTVNLVELLQPLLHDVHPEICQQAALSLGRLGTPLAADILFQTAADPQTPPWLFASLVRALGWIGTEASVQYLGALTADVAEISLLEIVQMLGRQNGSQLAIPASQALGQLLVQSRVMDSGPLKTAIASALGQLGCVESIPALQSLGQDPEHRVRLYAQSALNKLTR